MDDLVKRLRDRDIAAWDDAYSCRARGTEAADAIEALQARVAKKDAEIARLREALTALVETHDRENFMRSADFHRDDCRCLRCAFDRARAALGDDNG